MDTTRHFAELCSICTLPLEAAVRTVSASVSAAAAESHALDGFSCSLVGDRLLLLSTSAENRLLLVDLTESALRGELVDSRGALCPGARPLRHFDIRATASPFAARARQHELPTDGGEQLQIDKEHDSEWASGWVAARLVGSTSAFLLYPLDHCQVAVSERAQVDRIA